MQQDFQQPMSEREMIRYQEDMNRNPNQVYYDSMQEEKIVNIISQLNPDNLLSDIEYRLRGYKKNYFSGEWEKIEGYKEISERLIAKFISFLGGILNDNTRFSNYTPEEINNIMHEIVDFIKDDLTDNDYEYGLSELVYVKRKEIVEVLIKDSDGSYITIEEEMEQIIFKGSNGGDYDEMTRIGHIVCMNVFSVLKRALGGKESQRIFATLRVTESLNQQPQKKGFMDAIQFWK